MDKGNLNSMQLLIMDMIIAYVQKRMGDVEAEGLIISKDIVLEILSELKQNNVKDNN